MLRHFLWPKVHLFLLILKEIKTFSWTPESVNVPEALCLLCLVEKLALLLEMDVQSMKWNFPLDEQLMAQHNVNPFTVLCLCIKLIRTDTTLNFSQKAEKWLCFCIKEGRTITNERTGPIIYQPHEAFLIKTACSWCRDRQRAANRLESPQTNKQKSPQTDS